MLGMHAGAASLQYLGLGPPLRDHRPRCGWKDTSQRLWRTDRLGIFDIVPESHHEHRMKFNEH